MQSLEQFRPEDFPLETLILFRESSGDFIYDLLEDCPVLQATKGEVLLYTGQSNNNIYLILSGSLHVHLDDREGARIAQLGPGECVGEMSIIEESLTSACVTVAEDSKLLQLDAATLWVLINKSHAVARNLLWLLSRRVRSTNSVLSDEVERCELYQSISKVDALTGLHNRGWLNDVFGRLVARAQKDKSLLCFMMLDIDRFKQVNDTFGHIAGDKVLQAVARAVSEHLRPQDMAARYGGEELAIVLPEIDLAEAGVIAERLRASIENLPIPAGMQGQPDVQVTISVGVAQLDADDHPEILIKKADLALYRAKKLGRNRVELAKGD